MSQYGRTIQFHTALTRKLKALDAAFRAKYARLDDSLWSSWAVNPRSGARWSEEENAFMVKEYEAALYSIEAARKAGRPTSGKIELDFFAELAFHHGRSANACYEQLKKLVRPSKFYSTVNDYPF